MERNRSLVHILVSGLAGLLLGLFIGWWVWPVEWTDPSGAANPVQAGEPAPEQIPEESAADTSFQDWLNQALLYLAAALLVGGAVAIGYQFLRQPGHGASSRRSAGSTNARQAAVQQARRPRPVFVSGKRTGSRTPGLDWIRRPRPSRDESQIDEPVFPSQSGPLNDSGEGSRFARPAVTEHFQAGSAEASPRLPAAGEEEPSSAGSWPESATGGAVSPAPMSPDERDEEGLSQPGITEALPAEPQSDRHPPPDDIGASLPSEANRRPWLADEETSENGAALQQKTGSVEGEEAVDAMPPLDSRQSPPDSPGRAEVEAADSTSAIGRESELSESEPTPLPAQPVQPQVDPSVKEVSADNGPVHGASPAGGDKLAVFEANYAFGIQSYDESFTIVATDGELLGACGMGMNESLDRAAAETDQVRLLEIWLYDRSAVRTVSQLLVSPGFDATLLDDGSEIDLPHRSPPLELMPGLTCALRSHHIQLECTIKSVSYLDSGQSPRPLRSVNASLVVLGPA